MSTETDLRTTIGKKIWVHENLRKFGNVTASVNINTLDLAYLASLPTDIVPGAQDTELAFRLSLASLLAPGILAQGLAPLWQQMGRIKDYSEQDVPSILARLFKDYAEAAIPVEVPSRGFTYGTATANGANTGNGVINRLTEDRYGYMMEGMFIAETTEFLCVSDEHTGATRHQEVLRVRGAYPGKDWLNPTGSGIDTSFQCLSVENPSQNIIANPGFESVNSLSGSAPNEAFTTATSLPGWTLSAFGSFESDSSNYYKDSPNTSTPRSIRMTANASISQTFTAQRITWNQNVPLYCEVAFYRESSADGNLNIIIGDKTSTVALSAQSGWTVHRFKMDRDAWAQNWNSTNAAITISWTSRTTGTLLLDAVIISEYLPYNGTWIAPVGGSTPFLINDKFTMVDTCAETGVINRWVAREYGGYLPHTSAGTGPVWADPS